VNGIQPVKSTSANSSLKFIFRDRPDLVQFQNNFQVNQVVIRVCWHLYIQNTFNAFVWLYFTASLRDVCLPDQAHRFNSKVSNLRFL